jgi:transcription antitermination factor NusG
VAVDPADIAAIRRVLDSGFPAQPWPFLAEGTRVRVTNGPLENLEGVIVREKGSDRLVVSVHLLMRSVSVEIDRGSVARLDEFVFQRIERAASA